MPQDVFISYSSKDSLAAQAVCQAIEAVGVGCWIAPRNIVPGREWSSEIIDALDACRAIVLIYSSHSNDSPQVTREIERGVNKRIPILVVRIEDTPLSKAMEYFLSVPHWFDALTPPIESHLGTLTEGLIRLLGAHPISPPPPVVLKEESLPREVTFLFSDIEGSTKLWEAHPGAMQSTLAQHDNVMRQTIQAHGGHVFKTIGDAFCAVFSTAMSAFKAAVEAQKALQPMAVAGKPLNVRMALHTGEAERRDSDFFGPTLNRVARLLAVGHGGQVLLSDATRERLSHQESLIDLGMHRLKDLQQPERIWQAGTERFPALRSLSLYSNNLPLQVTSFVGREKELTEIKERLAATRLLTLTGSGGTGKTRLALQVAAEVLEQFPDGVWLTELAPLAEPTLVPQAVASVLNVREVPGEAITKTLSTTLKEQHLLLVLDNGEHLIDAVARLAEALVRSCPHVRILISSREALGIGGEISYRVPSLTLPQLRRTYTPEALAQFESVRMFVERAVTSKPDFVITEANARVVAQVCHQLDGIPLAIELAAGRLRSMPVEVLTTRLADRFRILTGGSRTALPRQQTLRALIDWSYDLLSDQEQSVLHRLSVFSGGATLEAAESVCSGDLVEDWEVLDLLTSLVDKSLVVAEDDPSGLRYRLLASVKEYALEKLLGSGEEASAVSRRHAEYFLCFAQTHLKSLRTADEGVALAKLDKEEANLRAALEAAEQREERESWAELALATGVLLQRQGFLGDAVEAICSGLQAVEGSELASSALHAKLLQERAGLHADFNEPQQTRLTAQEAMAIYERLSDLVGQARIANLLGQAAMQEQSYAEARVHYRASLVHFEAAGDQVGIGIAQNNLGLVERRDRSGTTEDWNARAQEAEKYLLAALQIRRTLNDRRGLAETLNNLGVLAFEHSNWESARRSYREAMVYFEELHDTLWLGYLLANLGEIAENQQAFSQAARLYLGSITLLKQVRSPVVEAVEAMLVQVSKAGALEESLVMHLRNQVLSLPDEAQLGWALAEP